MGRSRYLIFILLFALFAGSSFKAAAVKPDEMLSDPKLEARARNLSAQLRCMVCQNESIDESEAPLARDIRLIVREKISGGESDDAIIAFLVKRYGDFVLLKPRFKAETLLLWGTPVIILLAGGTAIFFASRRGKTAAEPVPLSEAEAARLAALVREEKS
jgi:cytochrome c-type biogenesis protein CcmH